MKFDLFGIIMMIVAVAVGQYLGAYLGTMLGLGGGIVGSLLVGLVTYAIYTFVSGGKFGLWGAVIFSVLIYVANLGAGYVGSMLGLGGGIVTLAVTGAIASLLWGWFGGKKAKVRGFKLK
jgi:hypothetical protein